MGYPKIKSNSSCPCYQVSEMICSQERSRVMWRYNVGVNNTLYNSLQSKYLNNRGNYGHFYSEAKQIKCFSENF